MVLVFRSFLFGAFSFRGRLSFGHVAKKALRPVVGDDAEDEEQKGAQHGDDHDDPTHGIALALGLEGRGDDELVRDVLGGVDLGFLVFRLDQRQLQAVVVQTLIDGVGGTTVFGQDVELLLNVVDALRVASSEFDGKLLAEHLHLRLIVEHAELAQRVERVLKHVHLGNEGVVFLLDDVEGLDGDFLLHLVHGAVENLSNLVGDASRKRCIRVQDGDFHGVVFRSAELDARVVKLVELGDGVSAVILDVVVFHQVEAADDLVAHAVGVQYLQHLLGLLVLTDVHDVLLRLVGGANQHLGDGVAGGGVDDRGGLVKRCDEERRAEDDGAECRHRQYDEDGFPIFHQKLA